MRLRFADPPYERPPPAVRALANVCGLLGLLGLCWLAGLCADMARGAEPPLQALAAPRGDHGR